MRKFALRGLVLTVVIGVLGLGSYAIAGGGSKNFKGKNMTGYEENLDVSTVASGSFEAELSDDGTKFTYELSYSGLEGTVTQGHIHFGKPAINGGDLDLAVRDRDGSGPESAGRHAHVPAVRHGLRRGRHDRRDRAERAGNRTG